MIPLPGDTLDDIKALLHWLDGTLHGMLLHAGTLIGSNRYFAYYAAAITIVALWRLRRGRQPAAEAGARWLRAIGVFCVAFVVDGLLVSWLDTALTYPRPPRLLTAGTLRILGHSGCTLSFPDAHSSLSVILVASLWPVLHWSGKIAGLLFVAGAGLSRIMISAHSPADVAGGALIALGVTLAIRLAIRRCFGTATPPAGECR